MLLLLLLRQQTRLQEPSARRVQHVVRPQDPQRELGPLRARAPRVAQQAQQPRGELVVEGCRCEGGLEVCLVLCVGEGSASPGQCVCVSRLQAHIVEGCRCEGGLQVCLVLCVGEGRGSTASAPRAAVAAVDSSWSVAALGVASR
jgi:hypothetical protein